MIVRGNDLAAGMSSYLADRILAHSGIVVRTATEVTALHCGCRKPAPPGQMLCRSRLARSRVRVPGGQVLVRPEMG